nr:MAG TPA: hypothetical protein [Caudoviricetes sp.]
MNYTIMIDGVDYTRYLSLPFNINKFRNDAVYLQGSLFLTNTKKSTKFNQNDLVQIYINGEELDFRVAGDVITTNIDSFDKTFSYSHSLTLVELVKDLDQHILPDFAVSLKEDEIEQVVVDAVKIEEHNANNFNIGEYLPPPQLLSQNDFGVMNNFWMGSTNTPSFTYNNISNQIVITDDKPSLTINFTNLSGPICFIGTYSVVVSKYVLYSIGSSKFNLYYKDLNTLVKTLYKTYDISTYQIWTGKPAIVTLPQGTTSVGFIDELGVEHYPPYKPYITIDMPNLPAGEYEFTLEPDYSIYNNSDFKAKFDSIARRTYFTKEETDTAYNSLKDRLNSLDKYYLSFNLKYVNDKIIKRKTLADVCNKAFNLVRTLNTSQTAKYSLDQSRESYITLLNTQAPEFIFQKNNLYEVLREVGRNIHGIPKLTKDNKIYFQLLDSTQDNPNFDNDENELYKTSSTLENYATSMTTDVSNMVLADYKTLYDWWPYAGGWGKWGAGSAESSLMYPDNAALRLDNCKNGGIYKVIEINVRNFRKDSSGQYDNTRTCHLIQYTKNGALEFSRVIEKSLWDSYSNNINDVDLDGNSISKAHFIYYTKGGNTVSLNELSSEQRVKIFGSEVQSFIYRQAICDAFNYEYIGTLSPSDLTELDEMKFQIRYIPYINSKFEIERPNVSEFKYEYKTTYSQESNNPSNTLLANTMNNYINRLGNDDLQKNVIINKSELIPYPGEYLEFKGDRYYCDKLNITANKDYLNCDLNYTKDYNKINQLVANPKDYVQYSIPKSESVRRYINFNDYVYIRESAPTNLLPLDPLYEPIIHNTVIDKFLGNSRPFILGALISTDPNTDISKKDYIFVPAKRALTKNGIKWQCDLYDNFAITTNKGEQVAEDKDVITRFVEQVGSSLANTPVFKDQKYKQNWISYTNNWGEQDFLDVSFHTSDGNTISQSDVFPIIKPTNAQFINSAMFDYYINPEKDTKEALSFIYNIHFITDVPLLDVSNYQLLFEDNILSIDDAYHDDYWHFCLFQNNSNVITDIGRASFSDGTNCKVLNMIQTTGTSAVVNKIYAPGDANGWLIKRGNTIFLKQEKYFKKGGIYNFNPLYFFATTEKIKTYKEN